MCGHWYWSLVKQIRNIKLNWTKRKRMSTCKGRTGTLGRVDISNIFYSKKIADGLSLLTTFWSEAGPPLKWVNLIQTKCLHDYNDPKLRLKSKTRFHNNWEMPSDIKLDLFQF